MSSSDNSHVGSTLQDFQGWESMYQSALRYMDETGTDSTIAFVPDPRPGVDDDVLMIVIYRGGFYRTFEPLDNINENTGS
ncbi:hypothetical protein F25303_6278 [Fusarium sp. NRRL 25303]|nr:hypothetical protein F25303_6278 [Fusarium sp. NRRL 25303]